MIVTNVLFSYVEETRNLMPVVIMLAVVNLRYLEATNLGRFEDQRALLKGFHCTFQLAKPGVDMHHDAALLTVDSDLRGVSPHQR